MSDRIEKLQQALEEPLLVTAPANVRYLTGFSSSNAALLVEAGGVTLFTDFRYAEAARQVPDVEFIETPRDTIDHIAAVLTGRFGFESTHLTYRRYEILRDGGLDLVPRVGLVERLRIVKDDGEQDRIRRAAAITDEAYERLAEEPFVGRTERELAWRMNELFHELGADEPAFETIVAAGANGARPHADAGDRVIEENTTIVIDAGAAVDGYCSDCTRTFATGDLPGELRRAYDVCLDAQLKGLEAARPGMDARATDAAARDVIAGAGFGKKFGHGLGHGVGIDVHEAPRLAQTSDDTLAPGNVVTIEPGIYLEGMGGIRIEDLVIVTDGEPEVLSSFPKELVTVS
ncbi:MAG TPA: Xaa-Pro peptidase family protein [Gaiellaceae bacterium]|nr:Xaa-Pro peptidase family protein [Gaiellaceae bacterium]